MNDQKHPTGPRLILILGGARSGKSTFAETLALRSERPVAFIATATAGDDDMRQRIQQHQATRPSDWHTIEEPLHLAQAIQRGAAVADVLLLDCMTLWLSNWLFAQGDSEASDISSQHMDSVLVQIDDMLTVIAELPATKNVLIVSNEVGLGIVPAYALGRIYRDMLGRINQRLASASERVYLMVAGLGVDIKSLHEEARL